MFTTLFMLIAGVIASALSFVFIRESSEPPAMLAAMRVLLAGLILLPIYLRERKRHGDLPISGVCRRSLLPGFVLGIHFIAWVLGARLTTAANATLIVNLVPVVMPFLMYRYFSEQIQTRELLATFIAIAGMVILTASDFSVSSDYVAGDLLSFVSMILFAAYLAFARKHAALPSLWLYIVPVYLVAGISTFIIACFFSSPWHHYTAYNLTMIVCLAVISTVLGHSALNYAMQRLRGQTVSIVNMGQFLIAGIGGYLLYNEIPGKAFYLSSALLVGAMILVIANQNDTDSN